MCFVIILSDIDLKCLSLTYIYINLCLSGN